MIILILIRIRLKRKKLKKGNDENHDYPKTPLDVFLEFKGITSKETTEYNKKVANNLEVTDLIEERFDINDYHEHQSLDQVDARNILNYQTVLNIALQYGHLNIIKKIVNEFILDIDINYNMTIYGKSSLLYAMRYCNKEIIYFILDKFKNRIKLDNNYNYLAYLIKNEHLNYMEFIDIVKYFLTNFKNQIDINKKYHLHSGNTILLHLIDKNCQLYTNLHYELMIYIIDMFKNQILFIYTR